MSNGADPRPGSPGRGRAPIQPGVEGLAEEADDDAVPRAHDYLERLLGDRDLLLRLQLSRYAAADWQPVAAEFARYGKDVMRSWIRSGQIFVKVREKTRNSITPPPERFDDDGVETLSTDVVVVALRAFLDSVLKRNRWDPAKGATLKTFFIGQCLFQFPNAYKKWWRQQARHAHSRATADDDPMWNVPAVAPADRPMLRNEMFETALTLLSTETARQAFAMQNMGYTFEEIAAELDLADPKAVENLIGHQRRRLQNPTTRRRA